MSESNRSRYGVFTLGLVLWASSAAVVLADIDRTPRIIRPPDDRADFFATTAALQAIGNAVAAQIDASSLTANADGSFTINAGTLAEQFSPFCAGERFGDQPTAASCTATLVGTDVLITAGHCLQDEAGVRTDLTTVYFVFDYTVTQDGTNPASFTADQVYRASEVLGLTLQDANDWAVVRLERAVTGRTPVGVRTSGSIAQGQAIVAIGFGAGLPMKFSDNATVQAIVPNGFEADFDIIGGNSGGPIINPETGLIEGVLSADQAIDDYFQDGDCFRATVCPQDPQCDASFTLLASIMIPEFQAAIQSATGGTTGGGNDGGTDDGGTDDSGTDDGTTDDGTTDDGAVEGDADGDGVEDDFDLCEDSTEGAEVDEDGCEFLEDDGGGAPATGCGAIGMIPMLSILFTLLGASLMRRRQ